MTEAPTTAAAAAEFGRPPTGPLGPKLDLCRGGRGGGNNGAPRIISIKEETAKGSDSTKGESTVEIDSEDIGRLIGRSGANIRGIQGCTDFFNNH